MKHVSYADKSLLMSDLSADTLVEYARVLSEHGESDTVTLEAMDSKGNLAEVTFLLTPAVALIIESAGVTADLPENDDALGTMRERMRALTVVNVARPESAENAPRADVDDLF